MALSMDEQRALAEIERRLADDDPVLAARLSSFGRPGLAIALRSRRARLVASLLTLVVVAVASVLVYTLVPFRAHTAPNLTGRPAASPGQSVQSRPSGAPSPVSLLPYTSPKPASRTPAAVGGHPASPAVRAP
jgi:hypothetical protein